MIRIITVTEASRTFADLVNRVFYRHESAVLLRGGKPVARIVPVDDKQTRTGQALAATWSTLAHLSADEADSFLSDIQASRDQLPPLAGAWD